MLDLGWNGAIQAVIVAGCTWYIRRGSKIDSISLKAAGETTIREVLDRLKALEVDIALVKRTMLGQNNISDEPGLTRTLERKK